MAELLRLKCPNCSAKHAVGPTIRTFECECGTQLKASGKAAAVKKLQPQRRVAATKASAPKPVRPVAAPASVQTVVAEAPPMETPAATQKTQKVSESQKLEPFVLKPREDLNTDDWEYSDTPVYGFRQILFADMWFLARTFGPYIAVAAIGITAFFYRDTIRNSVERAHHGLVQRLGPEGEQIEQGDELAAEMSDPSRSGAASTAPADQSDVEEDTTTVDPVIPALQQMPPKSAAHALQAKVGISCFGRGSGVGVVCGVVGEYIFVLTNRSLVDPTAEAIDRQGLPDETVSVQLQFSTMQRTKGELVWVADGGIDLAIIRCPRVSNSIEPVDWRLQTGSVAKGDRVFYVNGLDQMANAGITRIGEDGSVPVVRVNVPSLDAGTALYNKRGELIAISGLSTPLTIGSVAVSVSVLDQLQLSALLAQ